MQKAAFSFLLLLLAVPASAFAVSGTNAAGVTVEVFARQGGEWIKARTTDADNDGVVEFKDALPGKYRFDIDSDDVQSGQTLGVEVRVKDEEGRRIKDETDVDVYVYVGSMKVFVGTVESDDSGWIELSGITSGTVYEIDVDGDGKVSKKEGLPRIKAKAKIDDSDWFQAAYKRADPDPSGRTAGILEVENVLPGKYKFKYKDDFDETKPFTLHARLRDEDGEKIKKKKKVKIYAYPFGVKTLVAELETDRKGWITLPGVQVGMKYRLKVK